MLKQSSVVLIVFSLFMVLTLSGCAQDSTSQLESTVPSAVQEDHPKLVTSEYASTSEEVEVKFDTDSNLDSWIGRYEYVEGVPEEINSVYILDVHKSVRYTGLPRGVYYAEFSASGRMIDLGTLVIIQGDAEEISVVFYDYLPDGKGLPWDQLQRGDVLCVLKKTDERILTEWDKLTLSNKDGTFIKIDVETEN